MTSGQQRNRSSISRVSYVRQRDAKKLVELTNLKIGVVLNIRGLESLLEKAFKDNSCKEFLSSSVLQLLVSNIASRRFLHTLHTCDGQRITPQLYRHMVFDLLSYILTVTAVLMRVSYSTSLEEHRLLYLF